jgi:hypothetical protein
MAGTTLVMFPADAGRNLANALRDELGIKAAFWLYFEEADEWRLVLATDLVTRDGPRSVYQRLQDYLAQHGELHEIDLTSIALRSPDDPIVKPVREAIDGTDLGPGKHVRRSVLTGGAESVYLEDAYIYFSRK